MQENFNEYFNFSIEPIRLFNLNDKDNLRGVIGVPFKDYQKIDKDKSKEEKFNVFFDFKNKNNYNAETDLYIIHFDINKDYSDNFLFNFNNNFSLLIFELYSI